MKKYLTLFCIVLLAVFAAPGFADDTVVGDPEGSAVESDFDLEDPQEGSTTPELSNESINTYGIKDWIELNYALIGFSPLDNGEWSHQFDGWGYRNGGTNTATCHVVNIPSGAALAGYTVWLTDNSATGQIRYYLYRTNLINNVSANLLGYNSGVAATPGIFRSFRDIPGADHRVLNDRAAYWICIEASQTGSALRSSGVTFWYHLAISPAPASPSFSDVPTFHPFFREIEALARSGITTGFSDGTYRPNIAVTRQAMAAFLSRALGLHWPDF